MLGNKLLNIQFAKYHIWNDKSEGFPNMVLSTETFNQSVRTEYSEAVNARYTFQPLWVSGGIKTQKLVFSHAHNSLIHISHFFKFKKCCVVSEKNRYFPGNLSRCLLWFSVVIAIASEERDTEFESYLNCLLREREILRTRSQSATPPKKF